MEGEVLQIWTYEGLLCNISNNIKKGDLMYFASKETREVHHAVIITAVKDNEIFYAGHTRNVDNEPLSTHLNDEMVYIIRIRDAAINGYMDD